nr:hypothetical protein [Comamonas thiooxydans]
MDVVQEKLNEHLPGIRSGFLTKSAFHRPIPLQRDEYPIKEQLRQALIDAINLEFPDSDFIVTVHTDMLKVSKRTD